MKVMLSLLAMLVCGSGAIAQETIALAIEGWRTETREGVTYYRCASQICAAGSTVSYKDQPHRTTISLADFEKHHRGLAEQNKGSGRIRDVRISGVKERATAGVRVMQVNREVDWADNSTTFHHRGAADRAGQELQPRQRLPEARMDGEQFRGLPAPHGRHRRHQRPIEGSAHRVPTVARASRIGNNASTR